MLRAYLDLPRAVHVLCLGTLINRAGSFLMVFLTLYLREELGFSTRVATLAGTAYGVGAIGASVLGGQLADRIGRRVVMVGAMLGGAVILIVLSRLRSPWAVLTAVGVFSLVMDMYRPAASAMIADLVTPAQRGHAFGLMYAAINLGFAVAPVVGGLLAKVSFDWLFGLDAATAGVYAVIIWLFVPETLHRVLGGDKTPGGGRVERSRSVSFAQAARRMVRDRVFMIFCGITLVLAMVYQQAFTTFPLYLDSLGIGIDQYGWIIALNGILIAVFQLPVTALVSRFNRVAVLMVAGLVIAAGFGVNVWMVSVWGFSVTVVVWTVGEMMEAPQKFAVVAELAPVDLRARYMGVLNVSFSVALAVGVPLGGLVLERFGGRALWIGCWIAGSGASMGYLVIRRRLTRSWLRSIAKAPGGGQYRGD